MLDHDQLANQLPDLYPKFLGQVKRDGARPLITFYDEAGRIELSYTSMHNWVSKSANFAIDGCDIARDSQVGIDLSNHWYAPIWLLTLSAIGAKLDFSDPTFWIANQPHQARTIVVPSDLWGRDAVEVRPTDYDYAREVLTFPDYFSSPNSSSAPPKLTMPNLDKAERILFVSASADWQVYLQAITSGGSLVLTQETKLIRHIVADEQIERTIQR